MSLNPGSAGKPINVNESTFEEFIKRGPLVLVDFWAEWCAPCRMVAPILEKLAAEYSGKLLVGKLNVDENPAAASKYRVSAIPTLIFFKEGKVVDTLVGAAPKQYIEEKIKKHL
ncbi:MAG: thioredoxin [Candidatus Bathyarchaeia archaeon]